MSASWYCKIFGQELGPMTSQQLMEMARSHNLLPKDQVRRNESKWVPAHTVKGLFPPPSSSPSVAPVVPAASETVSAQAHTKTTSESSEDYVFEEPADRERADDSPTQIIRGLMPGSTLGNYIVLEKLGEGGMGMVLKARHRRMDRLVALKVLHTEATKSPAAVKRFQQEVKAAARLSHPNIVTAFDADEANGAHFLVMEFVEGTVLADLVHKDGPLPIRDAVNYTLQAAKGLAFAHHEGVVHRDIKPGNLLLDKRGTVRILDMGLARIEAAAQKIAEATAAESLTQAGQVLGTLDYMSPEQAEDARSADHRSDIYALGCTMFRLLTGRPPYEGATAVNKIIAHRDQPIPSLVEARKGCGKELNALFHLMVAKNPGDRFQSMEDVVTDLEQFFNSGTIRAATLRRAQELIQRQPLVSRSETRGGLRGRETSVYNSSAREDDTFGLASADASGGTGVKTRLVVPRPGEADQYFCKLMGEEIGPLSLAQLAEMKRKNQLTADDLVRLAHEDRWMQAGDLPGLF